VGWDDGECVAFAVGVGDAVGWADALGLAQIGGSGHGDLVLALGEAAMAMADWTVVAGDGQARDAAIAARGMIARAFRLPEREMRTRTTPRLLQRRPSTPRTRASGERPYLRSITSRDGPER
jgi:hypothetical protein